MWEFSMQTIFAAVDVETTGLDPYRDEIIEIAVVVFQDDNILEQFDSLVQPEGKIPPEITALTGISNADVADAPGIFALRPRLRQLVGSHVIMGHNVGFDMGFLEQANVGVGQPRLDTLTLASILVPEVGRFSLDSLAHYLQLKGYGGAQTHRALDDTLLTVELFRDLRDRASRLNFDQLEEIVQAGKRIGWPETSFFEELYREKGRTAFGQRAGRRRRLFDPELANQPPPVPREELEPIDVGLLQDMLLPEGNFGRLFPNYEYRPEQVDMLVAVADALNEGQHLLVEAGTGTGKSIGYLLPVAFWAVQNGRRVVVSTNTINLQDQLLHKDIPELQHILPFELRATVLKGKRNYLCTRLFQQLRHSGPRDADEMAVLARVLTWLPQSNSGDLAEITLRGPGERQIWNRLNAENDVCNRETCAAEGCPLAVGRRGAAPGPRVGL
jgi:DNA polymerase-3 subunit epsilon/ATP-dependent DNA helicase DinG